MFVIKKNKCELFELCVHVPMTFGICYFGRIETNPNLPLYIPFQLKYFKVVHSSDGRIGVLLLWVLCQWFL